MTTIAISLNPLWAHAEQYGPLYSNKTVTGTLAVDGWAVTFGTARRGPGGLWPSGGLLAVPNLTAHP